MKQLELANPCSVPRARRWSPVPRRNARPLVARAPLACRPIVNPRARTPVRERRSRKLRFGPYDTHRNGMKNNANARRRFEDAVFKRELGTRKKKIRGRGGYAEQPASKVIAQRTRHVHGCQGPSNQGCLAKIPAHRAINAFKLWKESHLLGKPCGPQFFVTNFFFREAW